MGDEITMRGYRVLTSTECTTVMTAMLTVTSGLGSSLGIGLVIDGNKSR
jgi:hypothetical protein